MRDGPINGLAIDRSSGLFTDVECGRSCATRDLGVRWLATAFLCRMGSARQAGFSVAFGSWRKIAAASCRTPKCGRHLLLAVRVCPRGRRADKSRPWHPGEMEPQRFTERSRPGWLRGERSVRATHNTLLARMLRVGKEAFSVKAESKPIQACGQAVAHHQEYSGATPCSEGNCPRRWPRSRRSSQRPASPT